MQTTETMFYDISSLSDRLLHHSMTTSVLQILVCTDRSSSKNTPFAKYPGMICCCIYQRQLVSATHAEDD